MKKSKWEHRLLSGILCASLVFQSLTMPVYATETEQTVEVTEMEQPVEVTEVEETIEESQEVISSVVEEADKTNVVEVSSEEAEVDESKESLTPDEKVTDESIEDVSGEQFSEKVEEITSEEATTVETITEESTTEEETVELVTAELLGSSQNFGAFENIRMVFNGYRVYIEGTVHYYGLEDEQNAELWLIQYDNEGNAVIKENIYTFYGSQSETIDFPYYNIVRGVMNDTRMMRFELVSGENRICSESFERQGSPDITFQVDKITTKTTAVSIDLSYIGDGMYVEQENSWECQWGVQATLWVWSPDNPNSRTGYGTWLEFDENKKTSMLHSDFTPNRTVCLALEIYEEAYGENGEIVRIFEQTIDLGEVTTKENKTYKLKEAFPDKVLRKYIIEKIENDVWWFDGELTDESEVTTEQLGYVSWLTLIRKNSNEEAVKDLTGIELLENLDSISVVNHEISNVSNIDWSKLPELERLDLTGNNISKLPDLSKNKKLYMIQFFENMLTAEELEKTKVKLPEGIALSANTLNSQRTDGFTLEIEENYYRYPDKTPFLVRVKGYRSSFSNELKLYVDGKPLDWNVSNDVTRDKLYSTMSCDLNAGKHTAKAALWDGAKKVAETKEYTFYMVEEDTFLEKGKYYISGSDTSSFYLDIYTFEQKDICTVSMVNSKNKVYAKSTNEPSMKQTSFHDQRYKIFEDKIPWMYNGVYSAHVWMETIYNKVPEGDYDLKIEYTDGSSKVLTSAIKATGSDETFVSLSSDISGYDNTGDYVYIALEGVNIEPEKLDFTLSHWGNNGKEIIPTSYVDYKVVSDGVIVKLRNINNVEIQSSSPEMKISARSGYDIAIQQDTVYLYLGEDIYYFEQNNVTKQLEVGFTKACIGDATTATVEIYKGIKEEGYEAVARGSATIADGLAFIDLKNMEGTAFEAESGLYYCYFTVGEQIFMQARWLNGHNYFSWSFWSVGILTEGQKLENGIYFSQLPYTDENLKDITYSVQLTGNNLSKPINAESFRVYDSGGTIAFSFSVDTSKLEAGQYRIVALKNGEEFSATSLKIYELNKFVLTADLRATWTASDVMEIVLYTPNYKASDKYKVTLTDVYGNVVKGLTTTEKTDSYNNAKYIYVKGLKYAEAYKQYYIKVTHNSLGEAYDSSGNKYFKDSRGELITINTESKGGYVLETSNRAVAVYLKNYAFPAKILIYEPYSTELIYSTVVKDNTKLVGAGYHFFEKDLYDSLPNKDILYDIVAVDSDNYAYVSRAVIGYQEVKEQTIWSYTLSSDHLLFGDKDKSTAIIDITNNKSKPVYKSSDKNVATVEVSDDNPNSAIITATGVGIAEISITADGITQKIIITVDRKIVISGLVMNKSELTMSKDETQELTAALLPAEAWTEENTVTFISSNPAVVAVSETEEEGTVVITALSEGTATITATLDGTEYSATCEITVANGYNSENIEALKNSIGTKHVLLNSYKNNTAILKDVELPDGWSWEDDSIKLTADNDAPIQYFAANYNQPGYETLRVLLPVAVSKLTGITVEGSNSLATAKTQEYRIVPKYTGYQATNEFDEHYNYQWTIAGKTPVIKFVDTDGFTTDKIAAEIKAEEVTKNTAQTVNVVLQVDKDAKKTFKTALKLTVIPKPYVDDMAITLAPEQGDTKVACDYVAEGNTISVDCADISTAKGEVHNTIKLNVATFTEKEENETAVKWTSSDATVATVKADKNTHSAVVTVKKAGTAVIRVMANDGGKLEKELLVAVKDYAPIMETNKLTINAYATEGVIIPVRSQNGNAIQDIEILENGEVSDKFVVSDSGNGFIVKLSDDFEPTKKQSIKTVLKIKTDRQDYADRKVQACTITVDVTKPTATVKVMSKANLFYTDAAATYTVSSKNAIESIEDVTSGSNPRFHATYNPATGMITLDTKGTLTKETLATFKDKKSDACKVSLKIKYAGYSDAVSQIINVTVATEEKKPSLKLNDIILIPGMTSDVTQVYDTKAKQIFALTEAESIEVVSDNSKTNDVTAVRSGNSVEVTYDGSKNVTYKAELNSANWTQKLELNGKITEAKQQSLAINTAQVTLNTAHNIQENGKLAIGVSVKNNAAEIQKITYKTDKKSAELINNGYLAITYNAAKQQIYVGLNKGQRGNIKAGSYKFTLGGSILVGSQEVSLNTTTLTITLADKAPAVALSAKGSIDLVQRDSSSILYTPKLSNVTAGVKSVKLAGSYAAFFKAGIVDGKVEIKAGNQPMSTKLTYPVNVVLTLDNGCEVSTTVKIKPVNKMPKITADVTKTVMYKTNPKAVTVNVSSSIKNAEIANIKQVTDKNSQYFTFDYNEVNDSITVSLSKEAAKLKPGTYTVSYQVYIDGAAYNVKPVTMKLSVTVK